MLYDNPQVPHEVNVTKETSLYSLVKVLLAIMIILIFALSIIYITIRLCIPYIPFSIETSISSKIVRQFAPLTSSDNTRLQAQAKLQHLAENLAVHMKAPIDMPVHIHLISEKEPNAFATIGGHIFITQGLLNNVQSENALSMVIAHELAHIKYRDPLASLSTGITFSLLLITVTGTDGDSFTTFVTGLTQMTFSRQQEQRADELALATLKSYYGHTCGAESFFNSLLAQDNPALEIEFFQTHPETAKRLTTVLNSQHNCKEITPLADEIITIQNR